MTTLTEGRHAAEFLISEANGARSRATGTLASGQNLTAGTVLQEDVSGNLVALSGSLDSNNLLAETPVGILYDNVDASGGAVTGVVYVARDAEVLGSSLNYPDETTNGGEEAKTIVKLATLGIIVR